MALELYAIGNALVDQEFTVSDQFLQQQELQKGTMQLADEAAQHYLSNALYEQTQAKGQASGGSAANTTVAFAALGGQAFYACRVGNDPLGRFYLNDLADAKVATSTLSMSDGETGTCMVMITPDGERTMHTYLGITAELSKDQVDLDILPKARFLYIEGYLATSPSAREAVREARKVAHANDIKTALSLSDPAMVQYAREGLEDLLASGVDILFCNQQEALMYTQTTNLEEALAALIKLSPLVIITRGSDGAIIAKDHDEIIQVDAIQVDAVDSNGAGDAFAGAFLYGLSKQYDLAQAGKLAAQVAGNVVAQFGPRLPVTQYQEILQNTLQPA